MLSLLLGKQRRDSFQTDFLYGHTPININLLPWLMVSMPPAGCADSSKLGGKLLI